MQVNPRGLYRAGELTAARIPTEAEESVGDVVRRRETFQREMLKSRHHILKFLARRAFVFRSGTSWCMSHLRWLEERRTPQGTGTATQSNYGKEVY